jgi:predicted small lipoprotein YifL
VTRYQGMLVLLALLVTGCGQTGDLFLPDAESSTAELAEQSAEQSTDSETSGEAIPGDAESPDGEQAADAS